MVHSVIVVDTMWGPREISCSIDEHNYTFTLGFMVVIARVRGGKSIGDICRLGINHGTIMGKSWDILEK